MIKIDRVDVSTRVTFLISDSRALRTDQSALLLKLISSAGSEFKSDTEFASVVGIKINAIWPLVERLANMGILQISKTPKRQKATAQSFSSSKEDVQIEILVKCIKRIVSETSKANPIAKNTKRRNDSELPSQDPVSKSTKNGQKVKIYRYVGDSEIPGKNLLPIESCLLINSLRPYSSFRDAKDSKVAESSEISGISVKGTELLSNRAELKKALSRMGTRDKRRKQLLSDLSGIFHGKYMKLRREILGDDRARMVFDPKDKAKFAKIAENCIEHDIDFDDYLKWMVRESSFTRQKFPSPSLVVSPTFMNGYMAYKAEGVRKHDQRDVKTGGLLERLESAGFEGLQKSELRYIEQICEQIKSGQSPDYSSSRFRREIDWASENVFK